jgi:hypothetical protein
MFGRTDVKPQKCEIAESHWYPCLMVSHVVALLLKPPTVRPRSIAQRISDFTSL